MTFDLLSYRNLVHAVSGAVGSVTAMTVFFPLDTARLMLQVDERRKAKSTPAILAEIVKEEGLLAPYRGLFPVMCSLCCSSFVYFYCFQSLKTSWLEGQPSTPLLDLVIGILAGVVNVLVTSPLWVVNTRLKLQGSKFRSEDIQSTNYSGIFDGFAQIAHAEGVGALWSGTVPSLLLVLNPAIQFTIYESLKRQLGKGVSAELSSLETFLISSLAKTVSTTVTYPLQTVQSMLRLGQYKKSTGKSRLVSSLMSTKCLLVTRMRKFGVLGLFKGLEAKLLQTVLTAALMFILYEKLVSCTFRVMGLTENHEKKP